MWKWFNDLDWALQLILILLMVTLITIFSCGILLVGLACIELLIVEFIWAFIWLCIVWLAVWFIIVAIALGC